MILLNESEGLSLTDRQTIALFEDVSELFKSDDGTLDLIVKDINNSKLSASPSSISKEPAGLKKIAAVIINGLDIKYKMRYRTYRRLSNEINNLYAKMQELLKTKIREREAHAADTVGVNTYSTVLVIGNKRYKFMFAELYVNYSYILEQITEIIEYAPPEQHAKSLASLKKDVSDFIYNKAWFVQKAKFETSENFQTASLDASIEYTKNCFDSYYATLFNESTVVENELIFIGLFNKTYDEVIRRCSDKASKEDRKAIDDVFFEIIKGINDVINWNQAGYEELLSTYHKFFNQAQKLYDKIK